jgi:hypothetical protein
VVPDSGHGILQVSPDQSTRRVHPVANFPVDDMIDCILLLLRHLGDVIPQQIDVGVELGVIEVSVKVRNQIIISSLGRSSQLNDTVMAGTDSFARQPRQGADHLEGFVKNRNVEIGLPAFLGCCDGVSEPEETSGFVFDSSSNSAQCLAGGQPDSSIDQLFDGIIDRSIWADYSPGGRNRRRQGTADHCPRGYLFPLLLPKILLILTRGNGGRSPTDRPCSSPACDLPGHCRSADSPASHPKN